MSKIDYNLYTFCPMLRKLSLLSRHRLFSQEETNKQSILNQMCRYLFLSEYWKYLQKLLGSCHRSPSTPPRSMRKSPSHYTPIGSYSSRMSFKDSVPRESQHFQTLSVLLLQQHPLEQHDNVRTRILTTTEYMIFKMT